MSAPGDLVSVPPMLYTRHIVAALDVRPSQAKYWLDAGLLPSRRRPPNGQRFVTPGDLLVFCIESDLGITPDWDAVIDVDD